MAVQLVREFNADMGELSLNLNNHWKRYSASSISAIRSTIGEQKVLFFKKKVERIEIHVTSEQNPFVIQKGKFDEDFYWAKDVLKRFCEKYNVKYEDELAP